MTTRSILLAFGVMLLASVIGAVALVLYIRSDNGASALERLERSNPAWKGIGRYGTPALPSPAQE